MILVDANVLIALVDPRQALHPAAIADLKRLPHADLLMTAPVLSEVCHLLPAAHHRARTRELVGALRIRPPAVTDDAQIWNEVFDWLARYAEHEPDWADAHLAILCGRNKRLKVWTYDSEFRTIWRRPDGTRIPMAVKTT